MELFASTFFDLGVNLQLIVSGLALGAIYSVVALGFVLVEKSTAVLNLAVGEFLMLGIYTGLFTSQITGLEPLMTLPVAALFGFTRRAFVTASQQIFGLC